MRQGKETCGAMVLGGMSIKPRTGCCELGESPRVGHLNMPRSERGAEGGDERYARKEQRTKWRRAVTSTPTRGTRWVSREPTRDNPKCFCTRPPTFPRPPYFSSDWEVPNYVILAELVWAAEPVSGLLSPTNRAKLGPQPSGGGTLG